MKLTESLVNKVSSIGLACAGPALTAMGATNPIIGGAMGTMGLVAGAAFIVSKFQTHGIDSKSALKRIRKGIEDRFRDDPDYRFYEDQQAISTACKLLEDGLINLQLSPKELAGMGLDPQGFPIAATEIVLERLIDASKSNPESKFDPNDKKQISFTKAVLTATFETAVLDDQYWNEFNKYLQLATAQGIGALKEGQSDLKDGQARLPEETAKAVIDEWERRGLASTLKTNTIMALARRLPNAGDLDQSVISLINALDNAEELIRQGHNPGSDVDDFVANVIRRISEKLEDGDIDGASEEADAAFTQWERDEKERAEAAKRNGAAILRAGIRADIAASNALAAARKEIMIIDISSENDEKFKEIRRIQDDYYNSGRDKGIKIDLEVSVYLAQMARDRSISAEQIGTTLNDLGMSFWILGQRETGTDYLRKAIDTYKEALQYRTRDQTPLEWAKTQNNLGLAFWSLGERVTCIDTLSLSVAAFYSALEERTKVVDKIEWARTIMNLGLALEALAIAGNDVECLQDALDAFDEAISAISRNENPVLWATARMNSGITLEVLGRMNRDESALRKSIAVLSEAIEVITSADFPVEWATAAHGLALAHEHLADLDFDHSTNLTVAADYLLSALTKFKKANAQFYYKKTEKDFARIIDKLNEARR